MSSHLALRVESIEAQSCCSGARAERCCGLNDCHDGPVAAGSVRLIGAGWLCAAATPTTHARTNASQYGRVRLHARRFTARSLHRARRLEELGESRIAVRLGWQVVGEDGLVDLRRGANLLIEVSALN